MMNGTPDGIDDGGPAFPVDTVSGQHPYQGGMSLRDWFAGMAMSGECDTNLPGLAKWSYDAADAMLAARKAEAEAG